MSAEDWWLIVISASAFVALGLLGWRRSHLWVWRWADMLYYPLGAAGILLLFFANDINRTLLRIEASRAAAEQAWRSRPNARPDLHFDATPRVLLQARLGWFDSVRDLGTSCEKSPDPDCGPYAEHGRAARESFANFSLPSTDDPVALARAQEAFCAAGFSYVDRLDGGTILAVGAFSNVRTALGQLSKGASAERVKAWLQHEISANQAPVTASMTGHERSIAEPFLRLHGKHALELLDQLSWCATRQSSTAANLKILDAWQVEEQSRTETRARFVQDLQSAKADGVLSPMQQLSRMIQQQWWPYILVLALAIKFGKACSGVASDLDRLTNPVRSRLGAVLRRGFSLRRHKPVVRDAVDMGESP